MKDYTMMAIGIFIAVCIGAVLLLNGLFGEVKADDIFWSLAALFALEFLCFLAHKALNRK